MSAVAAEQRLIRPHGGTLVDRLGERPEGVDSLERITLTSREVSDLEMLATGALSPLEGFMGRDDYERVIDEMRLSSGLPWSLPVCLAVQEAPRGDRVALADESGRLLAVLDVEETYDYDREREAERCFRTTDPEHPGVARLYAQHPLYVSGRVTVFDRVPPAFPELALDPAATRATFAGRGWKRVVGFQTRNPIHRAHEYLTKGALETVDGLLIHPLIGETKSDDVPAATRVRVLPRPRRQLLPVGPRRRLGLPGRDALRRAARGDLARDLPEELRVLALHRRPRPRRRRQLLRHYDAQLIFDEFEPHELDIEPMFFEHAFWCKACGQMATPKTCPHGGDDHVFLSGTKVRELLAAGQEPPPEFSRKEVAAVLIGFYEDAENG